MIKQRSMGTTIRTTEVYDRDGNRISLHRHVNPDGSVGGLVSESAKIHPTSYIHETSIIGPDVTLGANLVVLPHSFVGKEELSDPDIVTSIQNK